MGKLIREYLSLVFAVTILTGGVAVVIYGVDHHPMTTLTLTILGTAAVAFWVTKDE